MTRKNDQYVGHKMIGKNIYVGYKMTRKNDQYVGHKMIGKNIYVGYKMTRKNDQYVGHKMIGKNIYVGYKMTGKNDKYSFFLQVVTIFLWNYLKSKMCVFTNPSPSEGCNRRSMFTRSLTDLKSVFFLSTVSQTKSVCPTIYP